MNFLHPEFLWLAPLLAVPILIHLLNRVRYRRMRWAAIEFLLPPSARAVRRARLRQILLMILRTMVLAMALGALAQPIFSGGIGSLLGGSGQVAVALDASASMSAEDAGGPAFDRAARGRRRGRRPLAGQPRHGRHVHHALGLAVPRTHPGPRCGGRVHGVAEITGGGTNVPQAIRGAAESLGAAGAAARSGS